LEDESQWKTRIYFWKYAILENVPKNKIYRNMYSKFSKDASDSGKKPVVGSCEHSNETSGSIKGTEFLDNTNDC
jgi:hypothetical protein